MVAAVRVAPTSIFILFILSLRVRPSSTVNPPYSDESFTSILISQQGLDFVKNLLVEKAISSMIPLHVPRIEKIINVPLLGTVDVEFSNITIYEIGVSSSYVKPGDSGVTIVASGTTCNFSMNWSYSYMIGFVPAEISDQGLASVQVEDLQVGITLGLENRGGSLELSFIDCGCHIKDISIKLDGGASWFYQGMIDAFKGQIRSAVESKITEKLEEGIIKLDSLLQGLPKEIPVDNDAALNVTFINDPLLSDSSIDFDINGLFINREKDQAMSASLQNSQSPVFCTDWSKMIGISLDQAVFNSASALYYNAEFMQWIVDKAPDQSLLNTAGWRFIIPQLYRKYPNTDMNLNITLSSPPVVEISEHKIASIVYADLVIDVLAEEQVIPVACISLVVSGSGSVKVKGNNLAASVWLDDFSMSLKWSEIGNMHMNLIQPILKTVIQTIFVPYANIHLGKGFPLPVIHGFTLQNAEIICSTSKITVCSDVVYMDPSDQITSAPELRMIDSHEPHLSDISGNAKTMDAGAGTTSAS